MSLDLQKSSRNVLSLRWEAKQESFAEAAILSFLKCWVGVGHHQSVCWALQEKDVIIISIIIAIISTVNVIIVDISQCAGHCKKKLSPEMMMNLEYGLGQLIGKTQIYIIYLPTFGSEK